VASHILGDRADAEDVLQGVFVKIWKDAVRYDRSKASVRVWLVSCVRHGAIDLLRRREVQARVARLAAVRPRPRAEASDAPSLEDRQRRVVQAIETLPPDQREAIALAYFEGLSQSQIAERLKEPLGTVKTRIRLGMNKLRDALTGLVEEPK
jgi:RNA polymerase sigma-70 factor (ECF subfamily)